MKKTHWILISILSTALVSCAGKTVRSESAAEVPQPSTAEALLQDQKKIDPTPPNEIRHDALHDLLFERSFSKDDLNGFKSIDIAFSHADVVLEGKGKSSEAKLKVERIAGNEQCNYQFQFINGELHLFDDSKGSSLNPIAWIVGIFKASPKGIPKTGDCRFSITLVLPKSPLLQLHIRKGALSVEHWDAPIEASLGWGEVNVGEVGALKVECGRCEVSGEQVAGPVVYKVDNGNIGIEGLRDSVDGQTEGDTVLKWIALKRESSVKLVSRAGDVILGFPQGIPISFDLNVPKGEIYTKSGVPKTIGIPVSVTAEVGNIKVYQ